jgi:hypothetical protein
MESRLATGKASLRGTAIQEKTSCQILFKAHRLRPARRLPLSVPG